MLLHALPLLAGVALMCGIAHADGITLTQDGLPVATIVLAADAGDKVKAAADDLQTYVERMSGARLPIVDDAAKPAGALVLVGRSALTEPFDAAIPYDLTDDRRDEGFLIRCGHGVLVLAGNDRATYHGTEYAVAELLNRLGVRWYMPGDFGEVVPERRTIAIPPMDLTQKPDFAMRNWWLHTTPELAAEERRWKIRNKMNPDNLFATPGDSTARNILPESRYFKDHPEYFATNPDGSRNPHLPNLTSPEAVRIAADIIKEHFHENPDANSYGFAPDDGLPRDYTPETLKLHQGFVDILGRPGVAAEESITEEWLLFVNAVTREVRKEFPDKYIATNGYANRNLPPQGVELDDHLIIMFAAIWSCTMHPFEDPHCWQKTRQGQLLRKWCELCRNVWVYGYSYNMLVSCLTPLPEVAKHRKDFPLMKQWGVMGFLDEARNTWMEPGIASRYLRARMQWDADLDVDGLLDGFYADWYGKAAPHMRRFYEALEDAVQSADIHGHEDRVLPFVYTDDLLAALRREVTWARRAADTETARLHVRAERLIYEHLRAYVEAAQAENGGDFAGAAALYGEIMGYRARLNAISPHFCRADEKRYESGVWYWAALDRKAYFEDLADKTDGTTGDLVTLLPDTAMFRADPHDAGIAEEWYAPDHDDTDWRPLKATVPFYSQGYQDARGHPYVGNIWYRFRVDVPPPAAGERVMLYLPVVETEGWCWVNGRYVGHRGYLEAYIRPLQMELDVTEALASGRENVIVVRVNTGLSLSQASSGLLSRGFVYTPTSGSTEGDE